MPNNATELRYLIDPICSSCNDAGCAHCVDETLNDIPPEYRNVTDDDGNFLT